MTKHLRNSLQSLREALKPLDVSDFLRQPAEYIALYTPICVPPMASHPGHANLPKPFFAITYGECRAIHATLDELDAATVNDIRRRDYAPNVAELVEKLSGQLAEIRTYGQYIGSHPKYKDDDQAKAYHLTTFINNFTNSTPTSKSRFPEFSGTKRHSLTVGHLKGIVSELQRLESVLDQEAPAHTPRDVLVELQPAV
ncbi:MAG: hypothetical protein KDI90_03125 [Alphaproteobacteria bacterium]|nr:hypothetical protein [Alphaproteobacteria bacterium]MCB9975961.1 hypothetical protein [Rhodospirillales bacterium]